MLNNTGFDLWADGYDKSVGLSDENDRSISACLRRAGVMCWTLALAQAF